MLSLPEVGDPGGVVAVDGVHAAVLQPVRRGHPSALHLHGEHPGVPAELQDHLAQDHLSVHEGCVGGTVQLQAEGLNGAQWHSYMPGNKTSTLMHTFWNKLMNVKHRLNEAEDSIIAAL